MFFNPDAKGRQSIYRSLCKYTIKKSINFKIGLYLFEFSDRYYHHTEIHIVLEHFPFRCARHPRAGGGPIWFFLKENKWDARRSGHDCDSI